MGMPNSVEEIEINNGMIQEGIDMLDEIELAFFEKDLEMRKAYTGKTYMLDHCGDGPEYCRQCCQPECRKRMK